MSWSSTISWAVPRALAWGIALCAAFFTGVWDWPMVGGIGAGVSFGCWLGEWAYHKLSVRRGSLPLGVISGMALFFGIAAWRNLSSFAGSGLAQGVAWFVASVGFSASIEWLRKSGLFWRLLAVALFLFGCVRMLEPSTRGHLERPYWIVERVLEADLSPEKFWVLIACLLLPFAVALLRNDRSISSSRNAASTMMRRFSALLMWVALLGGILLLPQPSKNPVQPPPPPRAPDAPPPPPPPEKIAVVQFAGFCRPSEFTDNAYLFYLHPREKFSASPEDNPETTARQIRLNSKILLFSKPALVPVLIGFRGGSPLTEFDQSRFQDAWEIPVLFPLDSDERHERLHAPQGRTLSKMEGVLWEGIFEENEIRPEKAAAKIKETLEKAGKLSERALIPPEKWNLESFLLENTTGGNENFIGAAVELLQLSGLEARVVRGLRYDPGAKEAFKFKELILLSEANVSVWAEWRAPGGIWRPLAIHPETVLDEKPPPPPEEDLENLLAREAGKSSKASAVGTNHNSNTNWGRLFGMFVAVFFAVWLLGVLLEILAADGPPEVVVFGWMLAVLKRVGCQCRIGEGYASFEERLGQRKPSAASELSKVRRAVEDLRWELRRPPIPPRRLDMHRSFLKFLAAIAFQHGPSAAELNKNKTTHEPR